ncbi:MAG TPA: lipid-A-disaccharide synthase N-terminal domain-containing protein [Methylophilaceae bacterium]|jgi:lipid-A-disaccharide synthase-like uncharacterized protein
MDIHGNFLTHLLDHLHVYLKGMKPVDMLWLGIGLAGQTLFMMRFIVQWVHSERLGKSVIPVSFWYFSLLGGLTVLAYGFYRADPVIIIGQLPGTIVYTRNLMLVYRAHQARSEMES